MAHAVTSRVSSPANQLRDDLDEAERLVGQLDGENIEHFLCLLDRIDRLIDTLASSGIDLRPEQGRWRSLLNRLERDPYPIVSAANRAGGLAKLRQKHPPAENGWWHLDAEVAQRRVQTWRRIVITVAVVVVVLGGGSWVLNTFFPPDADTVLVSSTVDNIQELAQNQRWEEAMTLVETTKAQLQKPNVELLLWEGVLAEKLNDPARADAALAQAKALVGPDHEAQYWSQLGTLRLTIGDLDGAETAGQQAIAADPEEPQGYFLLGSVAEARGNVSQAVDYFNKTFDLAENSNPQLAVIARVRLGQLLQRSGVFPETPTTVITGTGTP